MPRKPRFFVPGLAAHVIQRGNNRQAIVFEPADYELYLSLLVEGRDRYACSIHAYVLMTNHVHLLLTPTGKLLSLHRAEHGARGDGCQSAGISLVQFPPQRANGARWAYHTSRRVHQSWE